MQSLIQVLQHLGGLNDSEIEKVIAISTETEYNKKTIFIKDGEVKRKLYFIVDGFIRTYQLKDGKEKTISFGKPNQFVTSVNILFGENPSDEYLETITDAQLIAIDFEGLEKLKLSIPKIAFLMNRLLQEMMLTKENRLRNFICNSALERYKSFMSTEPELMKVVTVNQLSSHLGVEPESLSRLRKKIIF